MLLQIAACGELHSPKLEQSAQNCRIIEHDVGQTHLCKPLQSIAALSPHVLDIMLALGVEPDAYADVSVLNQRRFDQPAKQIRYLGSRMTKQPINLGDRHSPALETLAFLKPNLILGEAWQGSQGQYDLLSKIAPTALFEDQPVGGWRRSIEGIAKAIDRQDRVSFILAAQEQRIINARQALSPVVAIHPRMLLLSSGSLAAGFYMFGQEPDLYSTLIEKLGFQLVRVDSFDAPISVERLSKIDTDSIIVISWDEADNANPSAWQRRQQEWNQIPVLNALKVSQAGRVYFMDAHLTTLREPIAEELILQDLLKLLAPSN
ncbi:ABC transporter substrate-binding protein [Microcoleus sp. FACHB-1515]|nr:ABC transporter substrate-binding protein [Microcoleus sp. FACHB-1515]